MRKIMIALGLGSAVFFGLFFFGNGQLVYTPPANGLVFINQRPVEAMPVKLRPGTYEVTVQSSRYKTVRQSVRIFPFQKVRFEPTLQTRSVDDITASAIGAYGLYGAPELIDAKWFQNNRWLAGSVGPGSPAPIALEYRNNEWRVMYFASPGYSDSMENIPAAVAAHLKKLTTEATQQ